MMGNTKIEWAEKGLSIKTAQGQAHPFVKLLRRLLPCLVKPSYNIFGSFGTIATYTSGDYVSWCCISPLTNRENMIPRSGWFTTIGAFAIEFLHQYILGFRGQWTNIPSATFRMLFPLLAVALIVSISLARIFCVVFFTLSAPNLSRRKPLFTTTAPSETLFSLMSPFVQGWARKCLGALTTAASCIEPVTTGGIFVEFKAALPAGTLVAPFKARFGLGDVLFK
jgi:hypothetical protein